MALSLLLWQGRRGGVRTPTSFNEGRGVDGASDVPPGWRGRRVMVDPGCDVVPQWSKMLAVAAVGSGTGHNVS